MRLRKAWRMLCGPSPWISRNSTSASWLICNLPTVKRCWSYAPEKSWSPCWATRTRNDPEPSAGIERGRRGGQPGETVRMVWCCQTDHVLPSHQRPAQAAGCLGRVTKPFLLRSDNGLVFTSRSYTALAKNYGLQQEFITPYSPEQNGMVERVIRTLKEQCAHRHRFESLQHASRVIGDWIGFYNHQRPHQALGMKTPAEAYALAA